MRTLSLSSLCAAGLVLVSSAYAQTDLIHTQVPSGTLLGSNAISSAQWMAESFSMSSATQIDSVMAYVLSDSPVNDQGLNFSIALYANDASNLPALDFSADQQGQLQEATATYSGDGWNGLHHLNWSIGPGTYWLAIEQYGNANEATSLQLPMGALPAAAVALYSGGQRYTSLTTDNSFGLQITAVPEPGTHVLMLTSLAVMGLVARRRSHP